METATKAAGTPGFQAPEQLTGENLSKSTDIYALGAVLTELFGGKAIWENISGHTILLQEAVKGVIPSIDHLFSSHAKLNSSLTAINQY